MGDCHTARLMSCRAILIGPSSTSSNRENNLFDLYWYLRGKLKIFNCVSMPMWEVSQLISIKNSKEGWREILMANTRCWISCVICLPLTVSQACLWHCQNNFRREMCSKRQKVETLSQWRDNSKFPQYTTKHFKSASMHNKVRVQRWQQKENFTSVERGRSWRPPLAQSDARSLHDLRAFCTTQIKISGFPLCLYLCNHDYVCLQLSYASCPTKKR